MGCDVCGVGKFAVRRMGSESCRVGRADSDFHIESVGLYCALNRLARMNFPQTFPQAEEEFSTDLSTQTVVKIAPNT
jgi:hypothetical protein